jgi:hypothetical protein
MRIFPIAALAAVVSLAAGCTQNEDVYSVSFRSRGGQELAAGHIMLASPLPVAGTIRGRYDLQLRHVSSTSRDVTVFNQLFTGRESGRLEWTVSPPRMGVSPSYVDFMPGFVDANIVANASPTVKGYWRGRWSFSLTTGSGEGGGFDIGILNEGPGAAPR